MIHQKQMPHTFISSSSIYIHTYIFCAQFEEAQKSVGRLRNVVGMFYYCGAVSEQRAARCIVATGFLLERGLPRDVESLHPRACMEVPSPCASCKICCQGQITQGCMPDLGQKDSNVIRCEDQEVRRSNTELTDEGPQGDPIH